jgi:hypothetical protein
MLLPVRINRVQKDKVRVRDVTAITTVTRMVQSQSVSKTMPMQPLQSAVVRWRLKLMQLKMPMVKSVVVADVIVVVAVAVNASVANAMLAMKLQASLQPLQSQLQHLLQLSQDHRLVWLAHPLQCLLRTWHRALVITSLHRLHLSVLKEAIAIQNHQAPLLQLK